MNNSLWDDYREAISLMRYQKLYNEIVYPILDPCISDEKEDLSNPLYVHKRRGIPLCPQQTRTTT